MINDYRVLLDLAYYNSGSWGWYALKGTFWRVEGEVGSSFGQGGK